MKKIFITAEIGINHNGDINIAKKLIDMAKFAGCDAVKFQKRNIDIVYDKKTLNLPRESQWGTTQRQQKEGLEFNKEEYGIIDKYCAEIGIDWYCSSWDIDSQRFIRTFNLKYNKIPSAMLTYRPILEFVADEKKYTFISTGMSNLEQIDDAVNIFRKKNCEFELMYTTSTYPSKAEEIDLNCIPMLIKRYGCKVGYSGHESCAFNISLAAVSLGASSIERHITLSRAMYGTDQSASIEIMGLLQLIRGIRDVEKTLGKGTKEILASEIPIMKKLRWFNN